METVNSIFAGVKDAGRRMLALLLTVFVSNEIMHGTHSKDRDQFITDHKHELGDQYAGEFWDACYKLRNNEEL